MKRLLLGYGPVLLWMGIIFHLSSQPVLPGSTVAWMDFFFKKIAHITVYGVLFYFVVRAEQLRSPKIQKKPLTRTILFALLWCFTYSILDEYHQSFTPGRHPSMRDIGYDMLGVCIAYMKKQGWI